MVGVVPFQGVESRRDGRMDGRTDSFAPDGAGATFGTARPTSELVGYGRLSLRDKIRAQSVEIGVDVVILLISAVSILRTATEGPVAVRSHAVAPRSRRPLSGVGCSLAAPQRAACPPRSRCSPNPTGRGIVCYHGPFQWTEPRGRVGMGFHQRWGSGVGSGARTHGGRAIGCPGAGYCQSPSSGGDGAGCAA